MGQIVVSTATSIDGFAEGPGGDLSVMPFDASFNEHNVEQVGRAGGLLHGATTYRQMVGHWPQQLDNPDPAERFVAERMASGLPVTVVSDHLTPDETGPWRDQTTIVSRADAHDAVARLRQADGDTVVFGSRTVWSDLPAHGLVDELQLLVGPGVVAGDAPPLRRCRRDRPDPARRTTLRGLAERAAVLRRGLSPAARSQPRGGANRCRPSRREIDSPAATPRTLLPLASSGAL